ncbi:MAG: hypothetical protein U9N85_07615, partial [Bacteroidota bacterium]|nr:hypothetical protein [Bacteroidota bacterium]
MFKNQFIAGLLLIFSFSLSFAQNAGNDQNICSTETQLQGDVPPGGFVGTWTVVTGSGIFADANSNSTQVTNIQKGLNIFRWTYDGNSDDVQVTNNTPTASAGPNRTTCNTSISFSAGIPQTGESGLWEQISGGLSSIAKPSLYNSAVSNLPFGLSQYKWTISNAYCSESDTMTVTSNYVTADAGSDVSSCNGTASILAVNPVPANGLWEVLGAGVIADPGSYSTTISGLSDGNNTMRWTVEYMGCSASDEMTITNTSVIATAGIDQTVCVPEAELAANNPAGTGVWSCPNTSVNIVSPSGYLTSVNNLPPGNTTFRWTVTENSCSSWDQITVTNAEITNADAGPNQTVCGYTTTLNAVPPQGGQIGSWTLVAGAANITDNQIYNTEVTNLSKGVNTFRWKLDNGDCNQTDDVSIINAMPSGAVVSPGEEICTDVYTLTGNNPGTGETGLWSKVGGATGTILSPSNSVSDVTDIQPGANTYRWTISNGTCSDFEELTVTNNSVIANAGTNQAVCGDSFRLEATDPAPASGVWSIETSSGTPVFDNSSLYNTTVRTLGLGQNSLRWHISKGNCSDDDFVSIFNSLPDIADAGADQEVCNPTAVLSANNPSAGAGVWTLMSGSAQIDNSLNFYTAVSGLGIGNTVFRWTISEDGCSNFDEVTINYIQVIADAGKDFGICTTAVNALDGNIPQAGQSGLWTVEGGTGVLANPESYNSAVSNLSAGGNLLTWTITESTCSESDDVSITNNIPTVATVSSNQEICIPETNIYGNQPTLGTGSWSVISGGGIIANTLASNTGVSNIPEGTNIYRWTISHEECTTSADIQVINNETEAITQADFSVCGSDAVIPANEPQGIEYGVWTVISGNGIIENSGNYSTTVSNLSFGSNILQWTMHKGSCSDYDDLKVTNDFFAAVANVAGPTEICTDYTPL